MPAGAKTMLDESGSWEIKKPAGLSASRLEKIFCQVTLDGFLLLAVAVSFIGVQPDGTRETSHGPRGPQRALARKNCSRQIHQVPADCRRAALLSSRLYKYFGAALVHRDPPEAVFRLRKIQCISQKTWNYLRCWLRGGPGPLAAQGGRAAKGSGRGKKSKIN